VEQGGDQGPLAEDGWLYFVQGSRVPSNATADETGLPT